MNPTIREYLRDLVQQLVNLPVFWADAPMPFAPPQASIASGTAFNPTPGTSSNPIPANTSGKGVVTLQVNSMRSLGTSDTSWVYDEGSDSLKYTVAELMVAVMSVRIESWTIPTAMDYAETLRFRLWRPSVLDSLNGQNISLVDVLSLTRVPAKVDTRALSACVLDFSLSYFNPESDPNMDGEYITSATVTPGTIGH
jgi:hypothetical protein